ncbi:hypothetical protein LEP1GSC125_2052 [Leptospira mayottensis 200901122]|uniref:Uncharacterized protein n=1 Tax=Leptospira mayottensis 200901122 TaxID=1193010 RepID=A0AA87MR02_9LEPT|nr:hypothetical protein LEP1GSC125_2052 [Leptospira mayottensis 200901122]
MEKNYLCFSFWKLKVYLENKKRSFVYIGFYKKGSVKKIIR